METQLKFTPEEFKQYQDKRYKHMSFEEFANEPDSIKLARIVYFQREQKNNSDRILNNVLYFFWISIISIIISVIMTVSAIS